MQITDDMLYIVLRRRVGGESVEQIQPDAGLQRERAVQAEFRA
ncbi:hypothetical protein ACFHW2_39220 [Actinomadura sp. LOL_016]